MEHSMPIEHAPAWLDPAGYRRAIDAMERGDAHEALRWLSRVLERYALILTMNADQLDALRRDLGEQGD